MTEIGTQAFLDRFKEVEDRLAALEGGGGGGGGGSDLVGYMSILRPPDHYFIDMVWDDMGAQFLLPTTLSVPAGEGDLIVEAIVNMQAYAAPAGAVRGQITLDIKDVTDEITFIEDNRANYILDAAEPRLDACLVVAGVVIPGDGAARELQALFSAYFYDDAAASIPNADTATALNGSSSIQGGLIRAWRVPTDLSN
jgi:hypothetical protein